MAPTTVATLHPTSGGGNENGHANGHSNGGAPPVVVTINGRGIDIAAIALMGPDELAVTAADLRRSGWPARVVQLLLKSNPGYTSTARRLTVKERETIDRGEATLSDFHNAPRKLDREIRNFLKRPGVANRVLRVIDHLTAPTIAPG
jgi:hypothetical protein